MRAVGFGHLGLGLELAARLPGGAPPTRPSRVGENVLRRTLDAWPERAGEGTEVGRSVGRLGREAGNAAAGSNNGRSWEAL